ncbi:DinB family protein [Sphaerobacter sp.]|uniref:DinB family protein n=1 Tax=Sphaerobacter sp. TaxID=2099654 RepID=UPI001DFA5CFE|nr:DinB family protein [Sphaerobacter sp.]MBX5446236.1 DinB family protein [Sphaerobacter sp.]
MDTAIQSLRDGFKQVLAEQHDAWRKVLEGLSPEALNWSPGSEMNSIAVLVTHAIGAEEFLIATAVGESVERDRDAEFRAEAPDAAALLRLIDESSARTAALLDRVTPEDLSAIRQPAGDRLNRRHPGTWWLLHAVEHSREHLGQALLTRQLYESRA